MNALRPPPPLAGAPAAPTAPVARAAWAVVAALACAKLVLHFVLNDTYGVFRDEYYYIACAEHLGWGYADHPPLSIALLALVRATLGESTFALRLLPVLAGAGTIVTTALLARELGGRGFAIAFAALLALLAPIFLANGTFFSMNAFEQLLWPLAALALARLCRGGPPRLWLGLGLLLGLAALDKLSAAFFGVAIVAGVVATPLRRQLRTLWPWAGAIAALLIVLPHLVWQANHGWPFLTFAANAREFKIAAASPLEFLAGVTLLFNPLALPVWLGGLAALFVLPALRPAGRALGVAFVVLVALVLATGGKTYYVAATFPIVLAAGAVATERLVARLSAAPERPGRRVAARVLSVAAPGIVAVGGLALVPLAVPTLAPATFVRYAETLGVAAPRDERTPLGALPQHFADRFGWENLVTTVAAVWGALPPEDQARAAILAGNYGEAGAIDVLGPPHGLPKAISLHNSYWLWGPGDTQAAVVVAVGVPRADLEALFDSVEERGRVRSDWAMPYETDLPVHVCRGLRVPLREAWAAGRKFL